MTRCSGNCQSSLQAKYPQMLWLLSVILTYYPGILYVTWTAAHPALWSSTTLSTLACPVHDTFHQNSLGRTDRRGRRVGRTAGEDRNWQALSKDWVFSTGSGSFGTPTVEFSTRALLYAPVYTVRLRVFTTSHSLPSYNQSVSFWSSRWTSLHFQLLKRMQFLCFQFAVLDFQSSQ